jgi:hypothetical protein
VNAIRIIALSVLLVAGGALAEGKKKAAPQPEPVKPQITAADKPKNCADQCKVMEKMLLDPCKQGAGANKAAQQACANNTKQIVDACYGSCKEKGRLDKQYIMERMKPPAGYKPQGGSSGGEEGEGDAH